MAERSAASSVPPTTRGAALAGWIVVALGRAVAVLFSLLVRFFLWCAVAVQRLRTPSVGTNALAVQMGLWLCHFVASLNQKHREAMVTILPRLLTGRGVSSSRGAGAGAWTGEDSAPRSLVRRRAAPPSSGRGTATTATSDAASITSFGTAASAGASTYTPAEAVTAHTTLYLLTDPAAPLLVWLTAWEKRADVAAFARALAGALDANAAVVELAEFERACPPSDVVAAVRAELESLALSTGSARAILGGHSIAGSIAALYALRGAQASPSAQGAAATGGLGGGSSGGGSGGSGAPARSPLRIAAPALVGLLLLDPIAGWADDAQMSSWTADAAGAAALASATGSPTSAEADAAAAAAAAAGISGEVPLWQKNGDGFLRRFCAEVDRATKRHIRQWFPVTHLLGTDAATAARAAAGTGIGGSSSPTGGSFRLPLIASSGDSLLPPMLVATERRCPWLDDVVRFVLLSKRVQQNHAQLAVYSGTEIDDTVAHIVSWGRVLLRLSENMSVGSPMDRCFGAHPLDGEEPRIGFRSLVQLCSTTPRGSTESLDNMWANMKASGTSPANISGEDLSYRSRPVPVGQAGSSQVFMGLHGLPLVTSASSFEQSY